MTDTRTDSPSLAKAEHHLIEALKALHDANFEPDLTSRDEWHELHRDIAPEIVEMVKKVRALRDKEPSEH